MLSSPTMIRVPSSLISKLTDNDKVGGFEYPYWELRPEQAKEFAIRILEDPRNTRSEICAAMTIAQDYKRLILENISRLSHEKAVCINHDGQRMDLKIR